MRGLAGCASKVVCATNVAPYLMYVALLSGQTAFISVAKGNMSGQQIAKQVIVRTPAEWKALWKDHAPTEKMPPVDFANNMVVGVFLGSKPTAGHDVEIISVRLQEKDLIVEYVQKQPGLGTVAAQILTEPYHLVSVPQHAGTVRFIQIAGSR
jgi:PrcB C-terminal